MTRPPTDPSELARLEARLGELDAERAAIQVRIAELQRARAAAPAITAAVPMAIVTAAPTTPDAKVIIGVYPLHRDERCHLLAIDFDKGSWTDDVLAFAETCRAVGLPTAVERSRSGNGAHAWFFFEEPVLAAVARKVGCYLLTETMARRPGLGMESYDRLFPNQDTMPRGGFGNLIALPLQFEARKNGNTVFLDDSLRPHADQWAFLAGVTRIPAMTAEQVAREAQRQGRVLGVRFPMVEEEVAPWARPPSGRIPRPAPCEPAPETVQCVQGSRFFVDRVGLPTALVTDLRPGSVGRRSRSSPPSPRPKSGSSSPPVDMWARGSTIRGSTRSSSRSPSRGEARSSSTRAGSTGSGRGSPRSGSTTTVMPTSPC